MSLSDLREEHSWRLQCSDREPCNRHQIGLSGPQSPTDLHNPLGGQGQQGEEGWDLILKDKARETLVGTLPSGTSGNLLYLES